VKIAQIDSQLIYISCLFKQDLWFYNLWVQVDTSTI